MEPEVGRAYQSEFAQDDLPFDEEVEQIWTRRSKEPGRAWSAFVVYRDLPPSQRTVAAAFRSWYEINYPGSTPPAGPPPTWAEWKKRWAWDLRAEGFDRENAKTADKLARKRHVEFLNSVRERYYSNAEKKIRTLERSRDVILALLESPLGRLRNVTTEGDKVTERLVDTLKQFATLSKEARALEHDVFAEVLAAVELRPEDLDAETAVQLRNALFEWVQDPALQPDPQPSPAAPSSPNAAA